MVQLFDTARSIDTYKDTLLAMDNIPAANDGVPRSGNGPLVENSPGLQRDPCNCPQRQVSLG